jgi:hypothetical protein
LLCFFRFAGVNCVGDGDEATCIAAKSCAMSPSGVVGRGGTGRDEVLFSNDIFVSQV